MSSEPLPVACTLTKKGAVDQAQEWTDLHQHIIGVESVPGGARMSFPIEFESLVADLAHREATCCAFLDISTSTAGGELVVDVTSTNPEALPVISLLAGSNQWPPVMKP